METQNLEAKSRDRRRIARKAMHIVGMVFLGLLLTALFALLFGFVIMWLWNWLIPEIFGLGEITFWQAFGIIIMARLLFTGFGMRPPHNNKFKNFNGHVSDHKRAFFGNEWDFKYTHGDWRNYKKFWEDEGKAAYEEYIKKTEEKKK